MWPFFLMSKAFTPQLFTHAVWNESNLLWRFLWTGSSPAQGQDGSREGWKVRDSGVGKRGIEMKVCGHRGENLFYYIVIKYNRFPCH